MHKSLGLHGESDGSETVSLCQTSSEPCSSSSLAPCIEDESIKEHAGWVMKRVRDMFQHGQDMYKIQVSKTNETCVEVGRQHLLDLIKRLGEDVLVQPGKFLFSLFL